MDTRTGEVNISSSRASRKGLKMISPIERISFILPTEVILPRVTKEDKKISLNLNVYRNLHHQILNQIKKEFTPIQKGRFFTAKKIIILYQVEKKTKRRFDTMNIISVVDKFFLDWLVNSGYLPDDNCNNVSYGIIRGKNGCSSNRVIAEITILE